MIGTSTTVTLTYYISVTKTTMYTLTYVATTYETLQTSFLSRQGGGEGGDKDFTQSPLCCAHCTYAVGDVQIYHWPSQTPEFSKLTNAAGYTL
jgi:hypothetical protein